ncbi:NosD domain-containing protein [uncultured Methanobrevibacter sp.]|uniref:NosD domain-containing protein n=1 Tax=uncultured Methanobrevibacter sp. TaxID=253161 RepID=UPI00262EB474|nr:NosD domain-containing protein [uncultured Methanobrevibacter sp.]
MWGLLLICCFILSLSAVSASDVDNSTVDLNYENVAISQEINENSNVISNNNIILSPVIGGKVVEINQNNYDNYFYKFTGDIKEDSGIESGDVLKIGNISNRGFVIDRQLTLMPLDDTSKISNGFIHLVKGSDGSTVSGLTINNTKGSLSINGIYVGQLQGIWLTRSNNNTIFNNTIRIANASGVYAMPMGWSSYNKILYNDMSTYVTCVMVMGSCHYNLISHNKLETLDYNDLIVSNLIYFNPFGHADYGGSPLCVGNTISYNYLKAFCNGAMSIVLQLVYDNHVNTTIANNTIIRGSYGINLYSDNAVIYNNTIIQSSGGISAMGKDISVTYNNVSGVSQVHGILVSGEKGYSAIVAHNNVTFVDLVFGIGVSNYTEAFNNTINIKNYGIGISITDICSYVHDNRIKVNHDDGMTFIGSNNTMSNNIIDTNARGISITSTSNVKRYYYNNILNNVIRSESYGIFIKGLIYKTTISGNVIETNASVGIYKEITDEIADNNSDNMINGVIYDSTALVINDDNFYHYFDENGYLNYTFEANKTKVIFFTFLSNKDVFFVEKINVISNKQNNLLFNVTLSFSGDASGSLIRDFNFYNMNKEAIILNGVDDITFSNNNITLILKDKSPVNSAISVIDVCNNINIKNNNIYVNSKASYAYAISIPAYNPSRLNYNKALSSGFKITGNTIIMIGTGVTEGIYSDVLTESEITGNNINIISDGAAYGIASCNVIGKPHDLNISNNNIVIHSKGMAYLIELHINYNVTLVNNYLYANSNGVYGIGIYMSDNISIINNTFHIFGKDLSKITENHDVLGIGQGAIGIIKFTNNTNISGNLIYANVTIPIFIENNTSIIEFGSTYYVIDDNNYGKYFNNNINSNIIRNNDVLLLNNLTKGQTLIINIPINITSYKENVTSIVNIILNSGSSSANITNLTLINSTIILNKVSKVYVKNNNLTNSTVNVVGGSDNYIINNTFSGENCDAFIKLIDTSLGHVISNNMTFNNVKTLIIIKNSKDSEIAYNILVGMANYVVNSIDSSYTKFNHNNLTISGYSIFGYYGDNSAFDSILYNDINIIGMAKTTNQAAIYFTGNSASNTVAHNNIFSYSVNGDDYAVIIIANENLFNKVINNYLISGNGSKRANGAVYALYDLVIDNTPFKIYVTVDGSDITGDGSEEHPYASLAFALSKALNHCIIYLGDGVFIEYNLIIDKNVTICAINPGKVTIDANNNQLFTILANGTLSINGLCVANGYNVIGGSLFINYGTLYINNSIICNSSSYFDNSNPVFVNKTVDSRGNEYWYTVDCKNTGLGGAILNYGNLIINSTELFGNYGHKGGAIADFGKTIIDSSIIHDNQGVHGGAIYTDSVNEFNIYNTLFYGNLAVIDLTHCYIQKYSTGWSIDAGTNYEYRSVCDVSVGSGGAIFNKNTALNIFDSVFFQNNAYNGGAIGSISNYGEYSTYKPKASLYISNCFFVYNVANSTFVDGSSLNNNYLYKNYADGGAIYGTFDKFTFKDSTLSYNKAVNDGGALYVQANDGRIDGSIITHNRAGGSGGALCISNNFLITNTIISNNSATYGGAISYSSYVYYGHTQNNLNIFNSTISDNSALEEGGAFSLGAANVVIHNSNIMNNHAPKGSTFQARDSHLYIDARHNYWESWIDKKHSKPGVLDDSVWNLNDKIIWKPFSRTMIKWWPTIVQPDNPNDDNPSKPGNDNNPVSPPSIINTKPSWSTNPDIGRPGHNGPGGQGPTGPAGGPGGDGSNLGPGDGGIYGPAGGHEVNGTDPKGDSVQGNSSQSEGTPNMDHGVNGSLDINSLSQINSANAQNLATVGLTANAASSASSSSSGAGGSQSSSSSSSSSDSSKSYELDEKDVNKQLDDPNTIFTFIGLIIVLIICLFIGYKHRKDKDNE